MITLLPIGNVNRIILESLNQPLMDTFHQMVQIGTLLELRLDSWNKEREQYYADSILDNIQNSPPEDRHLGIMEADIYAFGLNFVFGEADAYYRKALISLKRLKQEFYGLPSDEDLFRQRILIEAVHELGHTYKLKHCPHTTCVMHFSNSIQDTDKKSWKFCPGCQKRLYSTK